MRWIWTLWCTAPTATRPCAVPPPASCPPFPCFYNPEITNYKQDLDKAAQLIEQTGLKDKTIKIIYNSARVGQEELATMIKSQLDAAGLNAQIDSMETAAYFKSYFYATDSYDIALMGNGMLDDPAASWVCSPTPAPVQYVHHRRGG